MLETKYSKFLTVLLIIIIVAVIGLGGYLGYSYFHKAKIENDSNQYVQTFVEEVGNQTEGNQTENPESIANAINETVNTHSDGSVKQYKGYNVIGTIEIPKTNIKYPILQDPPTVKKLETSVVALYPQNAVMNSVGNVVIVGHNYRNGLFFSNNKKLANGDTIFITDLYGKRVTYKIYNVFLAKENDTSFYNRDTNGKKEITLSSCTDASNDQRIIIQAVEQ